MVLSAFRNILKRILDASVQRVFSTEILTNILEKLVDSIRESATKTENPFDDWGADFLESVVLDDGKMKILSDFIRGKLANVVTCEGTIDEYDEIVELTAALTQAEDGTYAASFPWMKIAELLNILIPILIDFFTEKED